mgnify:CR=1 FL=1
MAKRTSTNRRPRTRQTKLIRDVDAPPELQAQVDKYAKDLKAKNRAVARLAATKEDTIADMRKAKINRVRFQDEKGNIKVLELSKKDELKVRKPVDPKKNDKAK